MVRNQWFQCPVLAMGTGSVLAEQFNQFQTLSDGGSVTGTEDPLMALDWNKGSIPFFSLEILAENYAKYCNSIKELT